MVQKRPLTKNKLNLNKVKDIIFEDIIPLLDSFELEYTQDGDNIFMKCPIHEESNNRNALSISSSKRTWRCWTRGCHEHYTTDIFGFVKGCLHTDKFSEALSHICKVYDLNSSKDNSLTVATNKDLHQEDEFSKLVKIFKKQDVEYTEEFFDTPTGVTSQYFQSRGFKKETLEHFEVQDCNDKYSHLSNRAIIPIHSSHGEKVAYIARATKDYILPKFLISRGFRKENYFYNYHRAVDKALLKRCLFIVEGQGDVWRMYEAGVENCVGLFGKEISNKQKDILLESGITTLIILTDNDQAGRESKIKIMRWFNRMFTLRFPNLHKKDVGDTSVEYIQKNILKDLKGMY
jgi:DNA primase